MNKKIWWVTRPTRDLHDVEDALKYFVKIALGKKWRGNRELHKKFELNPAKTHNVGKHGSEGGGGRTWAAWLRMWGFWYDEDCVTLTGGGNLIVSTNNPKDVHNQIVHQIMMFQITSPYHEKLKQESGFKIFPFRMMLKFMLDEKIKFLTIEEIGLFLLKMKTSLEYFEIVDNILEWREKCKNNEAKVILKNKLITQHKKKYGNPRKDSPTNILGYWRSITDIANTLMINISYIREIYYNNGTITIRNGKKKEVNDLLDKFEKEYEFSKLYEFSESTFIRKFGVRYDRRKATQKDTSPRTPNIKKYEKIKNAIDTIRKLGSIPIRSELVKTIEEITNYPEELIRKIITENPDLVPSYAGNLDTVFVDHYMDCAGDGKKNVEFEELTRKIITMIGFNTAKQKIPKNSKGTQREIDGLILNDITELSGILEYICQISLKLSNPVGFHICN